MSPTVRLFWQDPYRTEFASRPVRKTDFGGQPAVVLDETCFYPDSGGQPHDTGHLNGIAVIDVQEVDGEIVHVLARPMEADTVRGRIDWARRFDHMQQHAGQHILSAAFDRLLDAGTLSFHLGADESTIDIALERLTADQAEAVEEYANAIVTADLPICAREYTPDELTGVPLRKPPQVDGLVRVISVGEADYSACGGTHPARSGEIGVIHIDRWERHRGGTRVTFLCGHRALVDYRLKSHIVRDLAQGASVSPIELPQAFARLSDALEDSHRKVKAVGSQLLELRVQALSQEAEALGPYRVIAQVLTGISPAELRLMAQRLCATPGTIALLATQETSPQFCFSRAEDVTLDMQAVLRSAVGRYGGRGGGQPAMAQGGGVPAERVGSVLEGAKSFVSDEQRSKDKGDQPR